MYFGGITGCSTLWPNYKRSAENLSFFKVIFNKINLILEQMTESGKNSFKKFQNWRKKLLGSGVKKNRDGRVTRTTYIFLFGLMLFCLYQKCREGFWNLAYFITSCYIFWNVEIYTCALMEIKPLLFQLPRGKTRRKTFLGC